MEARRGDRHDVETMPAVYRVDCDSCEVATVASESITLVRLDDGSEEICGHPAERERAEYATGISWKQLRRDGRILYRYGAACASCGKIDYYDRRWRARTHIGGIVARLSRVDLDALVCSACGEAELRPLHQLKFACPSCGEGWVQAKMWGIS